MILPAPETKLAECSWLPRIVAKARAIKNGSLPPEYAIRFGAPDGVDGVFLGFFGLTKEQIAAVAEQPDEAVVAWFTHLPTVSGQRIADWNRIAENMGRPGFPLADRLPIGPTSKYAHLAGRNIQTIFEMLNADESA